MKNNKNSKGKYIEWILVFATIEVVWEGLKYIKPDIDFYTLRLYSALIIIFGVLPIWSLISLLCVKRDADIGVNDN